MAPDPEPKDSIWRLNTHRAMVQTDSNGPEAAHLLEVKGRMMRIRLEEDECLVCELPGGGW